MGQNREGVWLSVFWNITTTNKRQADHISSEKLAGAWCNSRNNDFWNLVCQNLGNSKLSGCNIIDGLTTDEDISNMFSSKLSSLLNSDLDQSARE